MPDEFQGALGFLIEVEPILQIAVDGDVTADFAPGHHKRFHADGPGVIDLAQGAEEFVPRHPATAGSAPVGFADVEMAELIAEHTGQTLETIESDSDRDRWFTANEAKEYGFVDQVVTKASDVTGDGGTA